MRTVEQRPNSSSQFEAPNSGPCAIASPTEDSSEVLIGILPPPDLHVPFEHPYGQFVTLESEQSQFLYACEELEQYHPGVQEQVTFTVVEHENESLRKIFLPWTVMLPVPSVFWA